MICINVFGIDINEKLVMQADYLKPVRKTFRGST